MLVGEDEAFTTEWDLVVARKKVGNQTVFPRNSQMREPAVKPGSKLFIISI